MYKCFENSKPKQQQQVANTNNVSTEEAQQPEGKQVKKGKGPMSWGIDNNVRAKG